MFGHAGSPYVVPQSWRRALQAAVMALFLFGLLWLLMVRSGPVQAARPATIVPPGAADWTPAAVTPFSFYGFSVDGVGDVNKDGYDDVIVGAPLETGGPGLTNTGKIYVYLGDQNSAGGLNKTDAFNDTGEAPGDQFGYIVSGAGDVNKDGYADFLAGAPYADAAAGVTDTGKVYVYFGQPGNPAPGPVLVGEAPGDQFGWAAAGAGDVDGDGYDDIVVGAYTNDGSAVDAGRVYVYYGGPTPKPTFKAFGEAARDGFGVAVAGAGDLNGDGFADVAVGAWQNDAGGEDAGKTYVYYGSASGLTLVNLTTLTGEAPFDEFGRSVGAAGDVNGDGYGDLAVGAYKNDESAADAGKVYVYLGGPGGIDDDPAFTQEGEAANDFYGFATNGTGDANGDGFGDLVVGAHQNAPSGKGYWYGGCVGGMQASPVISATGETLKPGLGRSVAGAGDVNGDGYADTVVGAYGILGNAYVYYGAAQAGQCQGRIEMAQTVSIDGFGAPCSTRTAIKVPRNTTIAYCYTVRNLSPFTLTEHSLQDTALGKLLTDTVVSVGPGLSYTHRITREVEVNLQNNGQWLAATPILAPDGSPSISPLQEMTATAAATSTVVITISLDGEDTDGDGVPDNVEGTDDNDDDDNPAFIDPNEQAGAKLKVVQTVGVAGSDPPCPAAALTAPVGTVVNYCYRVTNTGRITLTQHTLTTSAFGALSLSAGLVLGPGATYTHQTTATVTSEGANVATWTAKSMLVPPMTTPLTASGTATATVSLTATVESFLYLPAIQK